ncbi:TPA: hypothetical protein ACQIUT_004827, partial [Escherichia coli]
KPRFARANWHLRFVSLFGVLQLDPEVILLAGVQLMLARLVGFCFRRCGYAKNCLQNATIVITGMSSCFGHEAALRLAEIGANAMLAARRNWRRSPPILSRRAAMRK